MADEAVDIGELVQLCAVDDELFEKSFFPKTFRQGHPPYAPQISALLNGRDRYVNILVFRGGFKTTKLRGYAAKRISYSISRTILILGKSESHALRTSRWLRMQVERNRFWAQTFGLRKGTKWQDHEFEIWHETDESPINIVAMGITGSTRGVNIDDYRPDLIILDDVLDKENSATPIQRDNIKQHIYGAIWESLAPRSEAPLAKIVSLATPQHREDYTIEALKDPQWTSLKISCWTEETRNLPVHEQRSAWPERWSDEELREEKLAAMRRNQLSIWMREKEVELTTPELSVFSPFWLQRWPSLPSYLVHYLIIDPVPPPSDVAKAKGLVGLDFEAIGVVGSFGGNYFIREILVNKGHDPTWTCWAFFQLKRKYRPRKAIVEQVSYQRTLKWILQQEMLRNHEWLLIDEFPRKVAKGAFIVDALTGPGSNGRLWIPPDDSPEGLTHSPGMAQFVTQFCDCGPEGSGLAHDDALEVGAVGVAAFSNVHIHLNETEGVLGEDEEERRLYPPNERGIPGRTIAP